MPWGSEGRRKGNNLAIKLFVLNDLEVGKEKRKMEKLSNVFCKKESGYICLLHNFTIIIAEI